MRIAGAILVAATLALPCVVGAEAADPLASARALMEGQEYDRARQALAAVIEEGELEPEQLADAYRGMAECYAALRRPDEATEAFTMVLALDPEFYVSSDQSPLVRDPFEAAQRAAREGTPPSIGYTPAERLGTGDPLVVEPEIERGSIDGLAGDVTLHLRSPGGLFLSFNAIGGVIEVSADELEGLDEAAFYLVLQDEHGNSVTTVGSPTEPMVVPIGGRSSGGGGGDVPTFGGGRPWYEQWWLWTAVGVVVVGLAVGLPVGLTAGGGSSPCESEFGAPCDITASIQ